MCWSDRLWWSLMMIWSFPWAPSRRIERQLLMFCFGGFCILHFLYHCMYPWWNGGPEFDTPTEWPHRITHRVYVLWCVFWIPHRMFCILFWIVCVFWGFLWVTYWGVYVLGVFLCGVTFWGSFWASRIGAVFGGPNWGVQNRGSVERPEWAIY